MGRGVGPRPNLLQEEWRSYFPPRPFRVIVKLDPPPVMVSVPVWTPVAVGVYVTVTLTGVDADTLNEVGVAVKGPVVVAVVAIGELLLVDTTTV